MYSLTITAYVDSADDLSGKNVVVFGATANTYSVVAINFTYLGLPTEVELGRLYPYACNSDGNLGPCQIIRPGLFGANLNPNEVVVFNGTSFESGGTVRSFFCGISNQSKNQLLAGGLAQEIKVQGTSQIQPLNTQPLPMNGTTYFETPSQFWIAAGFLSVGDNSFQPRMLMPTDVVSPLLKMSKLANRPCQPTFWPFSTIDFSFDSDQVATYSKATKSFIISPSSPR